MRAFQLRMNEVQQHRRDWEAMLERQSRTLAKHGSGLTLDFMGANSFFIFSAGQALVEETKNAKTLQ